MKSRFLLPLALVFAVVGAILAMHGLRKPPPALNVTLVGHQFWWQCEYPSLGIVTANELHIPVSGSGQRAPIALTVISADTDHSFSIPRLDVSVDVSPNLANIVQIAPLAPGIYPGTCQRNCGGTPSRMTLRIYAETPAQFAAWVANQLQPAVNDPAVNEGRTVFLHTACISCHTVRGTVASGVFGPDLTHLASRDTLASGTEPNTAANLRAFVDNPASIKPGTLMPSLHLNAHDLDAITAYLMTLK